MDVGLIVLLFIGIGIGGLIAYNKRTFKIPVYVRTPDREFPHQWRGILETKIEFYQRLDAVGKKKFEEKVHVFLLNVRVLGIETKVSDEDRMLVAASAVIPIFGFVNWAFLNEENEQNYKSNAKINKDQWQSGDRLWLHDILILRNARIVMSWVYNHFKNFLNNFLNTLNNQ